MNEAKGVKGLTILLLEDEPLILMDLEFAAEDCGAKALSSASCEAALKLIDEQGEAIDVAVLDVTLGADETCIPVARELTRRGIPYIVHSGDLDRYDETIQELDAELIAKPAAADLVINTAIAQARADRRNEGEDHRRTAAR